MAKAVYRNALRSKKLIQDAYLSLLLKKEVSEIKTCQVIALSSVSKGTFYAHYTCLLDVQQELENEQIALLFRIFEEQTPVQMLESFYPLFLCGLKEMEQNRALFRLLFRTGYGNSFLNKLKDTFLGYLLSCAETSAFLECPRQAKSYLSYVAGGAIVSIQEWLEEEHPVPPETLAHFLSECALGGLCALTQ